MEKKQPGSVYLVGAGPGDPWLITLRGIACLQQAEVVIHDRLINRFLLDEYASQAEWIDVGKRPDHHPVPQEQINAVLVEQARAGKVVVRLKGGDPFVFGRGGEEASALAEAGLPFEIIPGVSSAIAAPAYAGIPITQRGVACSAAILTGHRADCGADPASEWQRAARGADTLVFLMGVHNLAYIVEQLLAAGRPPDTPIALIEQATLSSQKTVSGTLENIVERAAGIRPPAVIVAGQVVALRPTLRWFDRLETRPLLGLRVLNTRPMAAGRRGDCSGPLWPSVRDEFSQRLAALGAEPVELPTTRLAPNPNPAQIDQAIQRLARRQLLPVDGNPAYDWLIFTSANAVAFFLERLFTLGYDARALGGVRLAAVGQATAQALHPYGLVPDFMPSRATGRDLAAQIGNLGDQRVLLPRSEAASSELVAGLQARGAQVEALVTYTVLPADPDPAALEALVAGQVDLAAFFSPSALKGLAGMLDAPLAEVLARCVVACLGPTTAQAAIELGVQVDVTAAEQSVEGMCQAIQVYAGKHRFSARQITAPEG